MAVSLGENETMKKIYLANPYGFSKQQRELLLPELVDKIKGMGAEVIEPFAVAHSLNTKEPGWAFTLAQDNLEHVRYCDGILAVVNGCPPDEGVMVELGFAMALRKKIFLFRDDFRRCSDSDVYPLNLMIFVGLPWPQWEEYWFGSVAQLSSDNKALKGWLAS